MILFGFSFKFELYVPAARRQYGPYTLAVLHGEQLVGRLDAALDRRRGVLVVRGAWEEPVASAESSAAVRGAAAELAAWLGAGSLEWPPA